MKTLQALAIGALLSTAGVFSAADARSDNSAVRTSNATNAPDDQIEFITSPDRIKNVASNGAPMAIWEALEHGEKVECLDCIASVEPLLYDQNARTREISAWWLRRRILGVFGSGEVYERTINTLAGDPSPQKRAYAAYALGEFLAPPGITACAAALSKDADGSVRAAAASALGRLNDDGGGALANALGDGDARVKVAALNSAGRINVFSGAANLAALSGDADANVRRRAVEVLESLHVKDSVASVLALAKNDADATVRAAACHALGSFADASTQAALTSIAANDTSSLVRDQAKIALRRL
jgi:hypothetical protein